MQSQSIKAQADMQEFIEYKLSNKSSSEQQAKAYALKKKYQRELNDHYQLVSTKEKERKVLEYEVKKVRKHVWNQLLNISNFVDRLEKQRHIIANKLRERRDHRDQAKREMEHERKNVNKIEQQLQHKINTSASQFDEYQTHKQAQTMDYMHRSAQYSEKIAEIEPTVTQYHQQIKSQQECKERINKLNAKKLQKIREKQLLGEKLELLNVNAIKAMNEREEEEHRMTSKKRNQIQTIIQGINAMIKKDVETSEQDQTEIDIIKQNYMGIKKRYELTQQQNKQKSNIKQSKLKQISSAIQGSPPSQSSKVFVRQQLAAQCLLRINELQEKLNKLQIQQKTLESKCSSLANDEQSKDKQIGHLDQTLNKIIVSLSK